ncbi:MAG: copper resistance protein CopC [Pseudohongiellaceae bacterium]
MLASSTFRSLFVLIFLASTLLGCAGAADSSPFLGAEPASDSVLNRAPRNLRLYFSALPDVPKSSISLSGPGGNFDLRGFHTMGADDLMIEITNPSIPDGDYVVSWTAVVGEDPTVYEGSYGFTVVSDR